MYKPFEQIEEDKVQEEIDPAELFAKGLIK